MGSSHSTVSSDKIIIVANNTLHPNQVNERYDIRLMHAPTYGPIKGICDPDVVWLRNADSLSPREQSYIEKRAGLLDSAWDSQLKRVKLDKKPPRTPVVAMALSGGGYRAMLSGSGMAFDPDYQDEENGVGDILGLSTYVSGLSGGSWAVGSFYVNDGTLPKELVENVWHLEDHLAAPIKNINDVDDLLSFYDHINHEVAHKREEKTFEVQITDAWAVALIDHLMPGKYRSEGGNANVTWSDLTRVPRVREATLPWPIVIALEREANQPRDTFIATNSTIFEFTPTEFGSWRFAGSQPGAFTPMKYLGSKLENGKPIKDARDCVKGFDNAGFVMGTSASLFNMALVEMSEEGKESETLLKALAKAILGLVSDSMDDVATYPNPFYKWDTGADVIKDMEQITLVDGGEADENVPLEPFLQPARQVDAIIAFDNSADVNRWPNGKSLHATYEKAMNQQNMYGIPSMMPPVPSPEGFVNQGLNSRPTFFGCDNSSIPTIIYIPNYPYIYQSNADTMKLKYSKEEALGIVDNGRRALNLNGTVRNWPQCLTCALMDNAVMQEKDAARRKECQECFDRFCWDGTDDQAQPKDYNPKLGDPHPSMP